MAFAPQCRQIVNDDHRCHARAWQLHTGRGILATTVAESPNQKCLRHDRAAYNEALLALKNLGALRSQKDFNRYYKLKQEASQ